MNYILALQKELSEARRALQAKAEIIAQFRCHLAGPKFQGLDLDGGRKDWISTADVGAWLQRILEADDPEDILPHPAEGGAR